MKLFGNLQMVMPIIINRSSDPSPSSLIRAANHRTRPVTACGKFQLRFGAEQRTSAQIRSSAACLRMIVTANHHPNLDPCPLGLGYSLVAGVSERHSGPLLPRIPDVALFIKATSYRSSGGQNTRVLGQPGPTKICHFTEIRKSRMCRATRPKGEGRIAIVTNAGRGAVDADGVGAKGFAGRRAVSTSRIRPVSSAYGKIVWSWRPGSVRQVLR